MLLISLHQRHAVTYIFKVTLKWGQRVENGEPSEEGGRGGCSFEFRESIKTGNYNDIVKKEYQQDATI